MKHFEELFTLPDRPRNAAGVGQDEAFGEPLDAIEREVDLIKRSFSGSWLGYHSRVYYAGLEPAPPGAHFSQEWGLKELFSDLGARGDWEEFAPEYVKELIRRRANNIDLRAHKIAVEKCLEVFKAAKPEILSILGSELDAKADPFLLKLQSEVEALEPMSARDVVQWLTPKGRLITRDMIAMGQGTQIPPHIEPLAQVAAIRGFP